MWVGIDVGKTAHHACATDTDGKVVFSFKVDNSQAAIEQLIDRAIETAAEVRWAIDLTSSAAALLIALLTARDQHVVYVPGRVVHQMSTVFRGEAKTDAKDARVIAETARMRGDLSRIRPLDDRVVELAQATAHRQDLVADWVRGVNRLRSLLTSIFPGLERILDCTNRSALVLLTGYQTPARLRTADPTEVIAHLRAGNGRSVPALTASAIAAAHEQTISLPGEATIAVLIARHATRLLDLDHEIKAVTKLIADCFHQHPDAVIIESMPGLGPVLGAEFMVATNGRLSEFSNAGHLASYAGLVPVPRDSGRITGNLRSAQRYNRRLRRVFYMAALSSLKVAGPSRIFYDRKRGERRTHKQAVLALARRLVDVLWALLRDRRTFNLEPRLAPAAA
ncbi:IS110 family transposase [Pseudonocardia sp. N23]|uniref:IS110 family transposase n=1 Tax=Pseudonocardia sp. N23 TaxID=1987376 RepID=UPI00086BB2AE|nr:MAG: IS110 family transposase [Pseudonocardia sp. SCN 72-86]